jgi:chromosome segregation ATPase
VTEGEDRSGIRARGEEALGDLAQALLDNPLFSQALKGTLGAGERAAQAQRSAMGALNVASGADLERIERRLRSMSDRLEGIEDQMDQLLDELTSLRRRVAEAERTAIDQARASVPGSDVAEG